MPAVVLVVVFGLYTSEQTQMMKPKLLINTTLAHSYLWHDLDKV